MYLIPIKSLLRRLSYLFPGLYYFYHKFGLQVIKTHMSPIARRRNFMKKSKIYRLDYDLAVEAYPRSAISFIVVMLQFVDPTLRMKSHYHNILSLQHAVKHKKPVVFSIREPLNAVCSRVICNSTSILDSLLFWIDYHKYSLELVDHMCILEFSEITLDIRQSFLKVNSMYGFNLKTEFNLDVAAKLVNKKLTEIDNESIKIEKWAQTHVPSKEKELAKEEKKEIIYQKYPDLLEEANSLYNEIVLNRNL